MNLDRLIQHYTKATGVNSSFQPSPYPFSLAGSAWAAKNPEKIAGKPSRGKIDLEGAQEVGQSIEAFVIRYGEISPVPGDRVKDDDGTEYEVQGVQEFGRRDWLRIDVIRKDNSLRYGS